MSVDIREIDIVVLMQQLFGTIGGVDRWLTGAEVGYSNIDKIISANNVGLNGVRVISDRC